MPRRSSRPVEFCRDSPENSPPPAKRTRRRAAERRSEGNSEGIDEDKKIDEKQEIPNKPAVNAGFSPLSSFSLPCLLSRRCSLPVFSRPPQRSSNPWPSAVFSSFYENLQVVKSANIFPAHDRIQVLRSLPVEGFAGLGGGLERPLIAFGSKLGGVALWDCQALQSSRESTAEISHLTEHQGRVSDLKFSLTRSSLLSCGYDGLAKEFPLSARGLTGEHEQIIKIEEKLHCLSLMNPEESLVGFGSDSGSLHLMDFRCSYGDEHRLHHKKLSNLEVRPDQQKQFLTSCNIHQQAAVASRSEFAGPVICLWDLRQLRSPLTALPQPRVVKSLSFSPNGKFFLASCSDNFVRVYDTSCLLVDNCEDSLAPCPALPVAEFPHLNETGIWITEFQPAFHPEIDELFTIGNLKSHSVSLYSVSQNRSELIQFHSPAIGAVQALAAFTGRRFGEKLVSTTYNKAHMWERNIKQDEEENR